MWPCHKQFESVILRQKKNYGNSTYFTMQKYNLQKSLLKETKLLQDIYNSITNLKFPHKPKYIIFSKSSYKN
jgi:hypothetical protein